MDRYEALEYFETLLNVIKEEDGYPNIIVFRQKKLKEAVEYVVSVLKDNTTTKGLDMPEATDQIPVPDFMDEMKKEVDKLWDSWQLLRGKLCQVERRIEELEK